MLVTEKKRTRSTYNKLNELTGREWVKFTKSWFIHRPEPRHDAKMLHPAPFPESLAREFIQFFTKKDQQVVDPFLGTGSSLIACIQTDRQGVGVEIMGKYSRMAEKRVEDEATRTGKSRNNVRVIKGNSKNLSRLWRQAKLPPADYCITSPPYWNQLQRSSIRQKSRVERGLDTSYGEDPEEIGTVEDYERFLVEMKRVFNEVYKVLKPRGYLTVVTNNVFYNGRMYPLAFDTVRALAVEPFPWVPKDEKVWCQDDKMLLPLGVYNAWVGNRHHQYCLVFRKETVE